MAEVRIHMTFDAPRERVFEALTDHATFLSTPGRPCTIERPGHDETNGLGCLRRVKGLGVNFVEEITRFERPSRYDYLIVEANVPLRHEGGTLQLTDRGGSTHVAWVTRFTMDVPVVGEAIAKASAGALRRTLVGMLEAERKRLAAGG